MQSPNVFLQIASTWFDLPGAQGTRVQTSTQPVHVQRVEARSITAAQHMDIDDLISELCNEDPRLEAAMSVGSKWVSQKFYADQPPSFKKLRTSSGFTQAQLAKKIETSQSYIARLEKGELSPGYDVYKRLSDALGVPAMDIFAVLYDNYARNHE